MKYNIPDDWSLETGDWINYCVLWPDSPQWQALFLGMITSWMKGMLWARNSGIITEVQKIGREIMYANIDLPPCTEEITCETDVETLMALMEETMPIVTGIKCEDGWLQAEMCCEWHKICELSTITGNVVPDDTPEPDPPPVEPTCYKAGGFAQHFVPWMEWVMSYIIANLGDSNTSIIDAIKAQYPQNPWYWAGANTMVTVAKSYPSTIADMLSDPLFAGRLQCALYFTLENHGIAIDNANWILQWNDKYLWDNNAATYLEYDLHAVAWVIHFIRAIDFGYAQTAIAGYGDQIYDCSGCIEDELSPQSAVNGDGWFLTQGYSGAGSQSKDGDPYNTVCLAEKLPPFNLWGIAARFLSCGQDMTAYGACPSGADGPDSFEALAGSEWVIVCDPNLYDNMDLSGILDHAYVQASDSQYNSMLVHMPEQLAGDNFGVSMRGGFNTPVVDIEITDVRFICNTGNLT